MGLAGLPGRYTCMSCCSHACMHGVCMACWMADAVEWLLALSIGRNASRARRGERSPSISMFVVNGEFWCRVCAGWNLRWVWQLGRCQGPCQARREARPLPGPPAGRGSRGSAPCAPFHLHSISASHWPRFHSQLASSLRLHLRPRHDCGRCLATYMRASSQAPAPLPRAAPLGL